jgi:hypothetical protein
LPKATAKNTLHINVKNYSEQWSGALIHKEIMESMLEEKLSLYYLYISWIMDDG